MARYIDADALIRLIEIDALCNGGHFSKRDVIGCVKVSPTIDVVPRAEVEKLYKEIDRLSQVVLYNDSVTEMKVDEAKTEVAREIFEEIEEKGKVDEPIVEYYILSYSELAELKKKYTGDTNDGT